MQLGYFWAECCKAYYGANDNGKHDEDDEESNITNIIKEWSIVLLKYFFDDPLRNKSLETDI
jgi:hypothetical protein